jgi:putative exosortase-associated protein (TIGR04073 family)
MKTLAFLLGILLASAALADIQDPPSNDYGPTRKLGRGLSNFFLGATEVPVTIGTVNTNEGNAAAAGYGVIRGVGRSALRHLAGFVEAVTAPFPINAGTYNPILPQAVHNLHRGFSEFPPELGNETKYDYCRTY